MVRATAISVKGLAPLLTFGERLLALSQQDVAPYFERALKGSAWYSPESLWHALRRVQGMLSEEALRPWLLHYAARLQNRSPAALSRRVGIVTAGNVPLVGFHDLLCVLAAGHRAIVCASRQDCALYELVASRLPVELADAVQLVDRLPSTALDALLATGRTTTMAHFKRYFSHLPHLLRATRHSCAWLWGDEPSAAFVELASDAFTYFGLGCRSVSKLYVPKGYDFTPMLEVMVSAVGKQLLAHSRYHDHYRYQMAIHEAGRIPHLNAGFVLLRAEDSLSSPVGVLNYSYHKGQTKQAVLSYLQPQADSIQAIYASHVPKTTPKTACSWRLEPLGTAQAPPLWAYADRVDVMDFLLKLV